MALVTEKARPADAATHQQRLLWVLRLLIAVLVVQILGGLALLLVLKPELLHPATMRRVEVVEPKGSGLPPVPDRVRVTSEMAFYYNGVKQRYQPQDESDAIEYACNRLTQDQRAVVRIERVVTVRAGRAAARR